MTRFGAGDTIKDPCEPGFFKMNKSKLLELFIEELNRELTTIAEAAFEAREAATNEESRAENKYDTRGLEASYLAGAQARRASELRDFINQLSKINIRDYSEGDPIESTALVRLEDEDGEEKNVFLVPKEGGAKVILDGTPVLMISPDSPLGQELWQKQTGDSFELPIKGQRKEFEIVSVS